MGFFDFFKPAWKHSEPGVRAAAIRALEEDMQPLLLSLALEDEDAGNRMIAARKIKDPDLLKNLRDRSADKSIKEWAQKHRVENLAHKAKAPAPDKASMDLARVALEEIGDDQRAIEDVTRNAASLEIRKAAFARLAHAGAFHGLAANETDKDLALKALEKVTRETQLESLARNARSKAVRAAAKERLKTLASAKGPDAATINRAKLSLVLSAADKLAAAAEEPIADHPWESAKVRLDETENALEELIASGVAPDAERLARFRDASSRFRSRYARWRHETAERERREKQAQENRKLKEEICQRIEVLWESAATAPAREPAQAAPTPEPTSASEIPALASMDSNTLHDIGEVPSAPGAIAENIQISDQAAQGPVAEQAEVAAQEIDPVAGESKKAEDAMAAEIRRLKDAFQTIGPAPDGVEGELHKRFRAGLERLERRFRDRENLLRRSADEKEHGGRLAFLCERAESLAQIPPAQAADRFRDLRREWNKALAAAGGFSGKEEYRLRFDKAVASTQESLDRMRAANLERMKELLPALEDLLENPDMAAAERRFKELNGEWRSLHPVPVDPEVDGLLGRYQAFLDRFREASDWLRWSNLRAKSIICEKLEALHAQEDRKAMVVRFKELQAEWKSLGPVPWDSSEALWDRYHQASDSLYEKCREYFAELDEEREGNLKAKEDLCARVEALVASEDIDWREAMEVFKETQGAWKAIGAVPKVQSDAVWARFRAACNAFFERKDGYHGVNLAKKLELAEAVESIKDSTEWKATGARIKEAQEKWKTIGPVPKDQAEPLWERFHGACETFYQARRAHIEKLEEDKPRNLARKDELCRLVEGLDELATDQERFDRIREAQAAWKEAGPVPRDQEEILWERFRKPIDAYFEGRKARMGEERQSREGNAKTKEEICAEAESIIGSQEWKATIEKIKGLQERWKATGPAPRELDRELWKRFRSACDAFFDRLKENSAKRDQERGGNLKRKTDLCFLVESMLSAPPAGEDAVAARAAWASQSLPMDLARFKLKDGPVDWNESTEKVKAIQREWKNTGPVPRDISDALWERFHAACDAFFEERRAALGLQAEDPQANLEKKLELIAEAESLALDPGPASARRAQTLQKEWRRIGAVPRAQSDYVWKRFIDACDQTMEFGPSDSGAGHGRDEREDRDMEGGDQAAPEAEAASRP